MGFFDKIKKALIGETKEAEQEIDKPIVDADSPEAQRSEESQPAQTPAEQGASEPVAPAEAADSSDLEAEQETAEVSPQQEATTANKGEEAPSIPEEVAKDTPSEEVPASEPILQAAPETESVQDKYTKGLTKSRKTFGQRMNELFANFRTVDEDFFEEVEETLIGADVGFDAAMKIADALRQEVKLRNVKKTADVQNVIIEKLVDLYGEAGVGEVNELNMQPGLTVILFVGVNGVGKTTSIGKLAHQFKAEGKKVLLAAADTFRAGAIDQLVVWGERAGVEVVRGNAGGDPAAVVFDAMERAKRENADVLLVDTAGRLQNKVNLMNELEKIKRIIQRVDPTAPHEVLLVLDATTGQNAMNQAKQFKETTDVSGLVLTKLDGTAKGGIVLAIRNELRLPVKLVGLGEGINDLEPFDPNEFVVGLFKGLIKE
ncbi:signal recognition particle-docking protein FtsY [Enterococcus sp. AZ089]|jgi:fused signal recognition particle receptor|uniref:signal recognition particle-docking protein FtsY n=1 Tax=unclassified Enterococcus TaxID=2608891 RepID=UPI000B3E5A36|nr:signal recognition particle-docking protein FtsY [Enterococcus sp. 8E11_MSG4843]MBE9894065.1 signal recognition particle-docking protein FtsY [Enterococcus casseliflavus]MBO1095169.1 signal recognition particle-docking protein FtsY [Enterococcus casseliflavus]MBO1143181.1 signal recognition particle-docking protein FtsY [Enterococcus casseliflavus]MBV6372202.1 signal recognition particle-docking protein FtsY [Enterococcus casseliflavus]OUZ32309.1 signal recognition particle-docking protein 